MTPPLGTTIRRPRGENSDEEGERGHGSHEREEESEEGSDGDSMSISGETPEDSQNSREDRSGSGDSEMWQARRNQAQECLMKAMGNLTRGINLIEKLKNEIDILYSDKDDSQ